MDIKNNYCLIMAGGIGSRMWPAGKTQKPKQFLDVLGVGRSLIQQTFDRCLDIAPLENIFILTHSDYKDLVRAHLGQLPIENILCEPYRRNTAPCIAYGIFKISEQNKNANIVITPSDHLILDVAKYNENILETLDFTSKTTNIAILGIKPSTPNTGYGYIQFDNTELDNFYPVRLFTEKPNLELAQTFLDSGDFLWNSGIFIANVATFLKSYEKYSSEIYAIFDDIKTELGSSAEEDAIQTAFMQCPSISFDYAILEHSKNIYVMPVSFGWSDLGTWGSIYNASPKDTNDNVVNAKNAALYNTQNCVVFAENHKLVLIDGLKDFIIVDSKEALMICPTSKEQEIKNYVTELKKSKGEKYF